MSTFTTLRRAVTVAWDSWPFVQYEPLMSLPNDGNYGSSLSRIKGMRQVISQPSEFPHRSLQGREMEVLLVFLDRSHRTLHGKGRDQQHMVSNCITCPAWLRFYVSSQLRNSIMRQCCAEADTRVIPPTSSQIVYL